LEIVVYNFFAIRARTKIEEREREKKRGEKMERKREVG